jgi:hypothetical protein
MPDLSAKKVLVIDIEKQTYEVRSFPDLWKYVGGIGLGLKLLQQYISKDPIVLAVGPLNGYFPYCSKTAVVINESGVVEDEYFGGSLSLRIRYAGLDAIVITGNSTNPIILDINNNETNFKNADTNIDSLGLPGKRSVIGFESDKLCIDNYFYTPENFLEKKFVNKNIIGITITGNETYKLKDFSRYSKIYKELLNRQQDINIAKSSFPACSNCPIGCDRSKFGEMGGNVFIHCLCACQYAEKIYSDVGVAFSCLNVLGYDYKHEDIENVPNLIEKTLKELA